MAIYIVTYDLCSESSPDSFHKLQSLIKEDRRWACLGESSYLIESDRTAVELRDSFKEILGPDDVLYVGMVSAPAAWIGYSKEVTEWIINKLHR